MSCSKIAQRTGNPDFISHLPAPIIHHILSLLSDNKESGRTCVLSKTWRNFYASRPIMVFHEKDFIPCDSFIISIEGRRLFMNYVDQSLNRIIQMNSNPLEKFELHLSLCDPGGKPQSGHVNQWLQKVFGLGVKTMSLGLGSGNNLSQLVLVSQTLVEVHLDCFCFIKACRRISLPNLKVLTLFHVDLAKGLLKKLISECPLVEVLRLSHCNTSPNLKVSSLARLVELTVFFCSNIETVEIGSPFFQTFVQVGQSKASTIAFLGSCETVRKLELYMWPSDDISAFKWLEELSLVSLLIKGRISSQSIKRLVIRLCRAETEVAEIDCPNLLTLEYEANHMPFRFVSECDPRDFRYEFSLLRKGRSVQMDALETLFGSIFISATKNLKVVIILGHLKDVIILDGLIEVMLSILYKIGDLLEPRIFITSYSIDWNAILPAYHPKIDHLAVNLVSLCDSKFPKVVWEKFLSLQKSGTERYVNVCSVKKDYRKTNIPAELQPHQGSQYQMSRIILKFDWSKCMMKDHRKKNIPGELQQHQGSQ